MLIVNADDFGMSVGINRGVVEAHARGIVTSTSLMVRGGAAADAADRARACPALSIGLHLDLGEWEFAEDEWRLRYQIVDTEDGTAVAKEVESQLEGFVALTGGLPTHLDSHQHVHRGGPPRHSLAAAGERLGIPVREVTQGIRYAGVFYGQSGKGHPVPDAITVEALVAVIAGVPPGVTELGCHPGMGEIDSVYGAERAAELATLCDPRVRAVLETANVELRSFSEVTQGTAGSGATAAPRPGDAADSADR
jgi:predicted glycoside hydrolase/deacetylase ChbG (UPF0249 family)